MIERKNPTSVQHTANSLRRVYDSLYDAIEDGKQEGTILNGWRYSR